MREDEPREIGFLAAHLRRLQPQLSSRAGEFTEAERHLVAMLDSWHRIYQVLRDDDEKACTDKLAVNRQIVEEFQFMIKELEALGGVWGIRDLERSD